MKEASFPLHETCSDRIVKVAAIERILVESPDALYKTSEEGTLPIHVARCAKASVEIIELLVDKWLLSLEWTNHGGVLPLHTACSNHASLEVIENLVTVY